ncbi:MAG TPA: hypothetical protein VH684_27060 [Xanthobacteraceae bacterium]|jgi:hypothetical protein
MWKTAIQKRSALGVALGAALLSAAPISLHWSAATAPSLSVDRADAQARRAAPATAAPAKTDEYKYPTGRSANEGGMGYNVQNSANTSISPELYAACLNRTYGACPEQ